MHGCHVAHLFSLNILLEAEEHLHLIELSAGTIFPLPPEVLGHGWVFESQSEVLLMNLGRIIRVNRAEHSIELLFPVRCLIVDFIGYSSSQIFVGPVVNDIQNLLCVQFFALANFLEEVDQLLLV